MNKGFVAKSDETLSFVIRKLSACPLFREFGR